MGGVKQEIKMSIVKRHLAEHAVDAVIHILGVLFAINGGLSMGSGSNFLEAAKREMPEKLILCTTGSKFTFTA